MLSLVRIVFTSSDIFLSDFSPIFRIASLYGLGMSNDTVLISDTISLGHLLVVDISVVKAAALLLVVFNECSSTQTLAD